MTATNRARSRWACRHCGSTDVRVRIEAWAREDTTLAVSDIEVESVKGWHCRCCRASEDGEPIEASSVREPEDRGALADAAHDRRVEEALYREGIL